MAGQAAHGPLLAHEPLALLVEFDRQYLHRHPAVQRELRATVDDAEAATPNFFGVGEPGSTQLRDDG